jgi:hypothetical protein
LRAAEARGKTKNQKEGRKMKNQLKTQVASMDSGLSSAQFRF